MAFERPTLTELVDRIQTDFVSRLDLTGALLRRSLVYVLARVVAGASHMMHGHLDFLSRQQFPDTAEAEYLRRWGSLFSVDPTEAGFAEATVTITGTNATLVPAGTVLLRSDGAEYTTDADATIASGTASVAVTAALAGADGTLTAGVVLTFESPVAGADSSATVSASTADGTDAEADADYRVRVLERMRAAPHGGNAADYVAWAKEVSGVTRAWCYPRELGEGTVVVRFVRDNDASLIPDAGEVTAVQDYIDALRPVTAAVTVSAPTATPLAYSIALDPDTSAIREAVEAELADLHLQAGEPGATIYLSQVRTAIGNGIKAAAVDPESADYTLAAPAADVTHTAGQLSTLGTITFT